MKCNYPQLREIRSGSREGRMREAVTQTAKKKKFLSTLSLIDLQ